MKLRLRRTLAYIAAALFIFELGKISALFGHITTACAFVTIIVSLATIRGWELKPL